MYIDKSQMQIGNSGPTSLVYNKSQTCTKLYSQCFSNHCKTKDWQKTNLSWNNCSTLQVGVLILCTWQMYKGITCF